MVYASLNPQNSGYINYEKMQSAFPINNEIWNKYMARW